MSKLSGKAKGTIFIICSALCFALMNAFVRLAGDLPSIEKSFFRNAVAAVIAFATLIRDGNGFGWKKSNLTGLILRSAFGTMGILCNFYAVDHLLLADASMLNKLSPFFAIIFSYLILREKVTLFQSAMVVIAFIGSLFIIKPSSVSFNMASLIGFLGGMCAGIAYTMVRKLTENGERKSYIVFFFSMFSCVVTLPYLIFDFHPMTIRQFIILMFAGISAAGGQFSITAAYSYAPAREISVFDYTQIIFSALLGLFLFEQIPDIYSLLGYVIICGVSLIMFLKNKNSTKK